LIFLENIFVAEILEKIIFFLKSVPKEFQSKGEEDVDLFVKPDVSQMIPFKPRRIPVPGSHPISGGEFPMPQGKVL